jgi:DNA-binding SARP family transcriptional activator
MPDDHPLQFQVLGPLRVSRAGGTVNLGPSQQRVVMAVLLANANRSLGRQQLIDAVWDDPPAWAVNLLQRHVSRLRHALEPDRTARSGPSILQWSEAGYRLAVPPKSLDLAIFDETVREARAARLAGDLAGAAELLDSALDLWRGPLCDGLDSPFLEAERARMDERRVSVVEDRMELGVLLGPQPETIEQLRRLVEEHPFRERLHRLLMQALYRADRSADALAAYQDARRRLREELGIEPSVELQRLHTQVLNKDPTLLGSGPPEPSRSAARSADASALPLTPAQLPHALADFVGRDNELGLLEAAVRERDRATTTVITAITGSAGVGKTSLALHWAHQARLRFPDGQLYVNLRGCDPNADPISPAAVIRGFLDGFGVDVERIPVDLEQQAALYRSLLAGRRVLVVLDNARDAEQARPLLPGSPGCAAVVTSRDQLVGLVVADGARALALDVLPAGVARDLLVRRLGADRVSAEPAAVDSIIAACARLPLALSVVAARARTHSTFTLAALAGELQAAKGTLDVFDAGEHTVDVRAAFSLSYNGLNEPTARLFRHLALIPGPDVSTAAAASLSALRPSNVRSHLGQLARANLVTERAPGRFAMHDLLRTYAGELSLSCDREEDLRETYRRLLDHYVHTAVHASRLLNPYRDDAVEVGLPALGVTIEPLRDHQDAMRWFEDERLTLIAATRRAAEDRFETHAWQLAWTMAHFLERRAYWEDAADVHAVAVRAAERIGETRAQALSRGDLAYALGRRERLDDAARQLAQALELYERLDDVIGMAHAHYTLTWVLDSQRRYDEALSHAQDALQLFEQIGHPPGEARALNALGWFHYQLGDPARTHYFCQRALDLQREIGARYDQANTLDSVGRAHHALGRSEEAIACFKESIDVYREYGHRYNEADELVVLGDIYQTVGSSAEARNAWRCALEILEDLGHADAATVRDRLAFPRP